MDSKTSRDSSSKNEKRMNLPFGYRFDPTGMELIEFYLIPKMKGEELPSNYVMDLDDVYQFEPHQLSFYQFKHVKKNKAFFFTKDSRTNSAGESQIRTAPNGYWKVYKDNVPVDQVDRSDEVIGFATKLLFHDVHGNKTNWKMIEYRCHPSRIPTVTNNMKDYIVCKIKSKEVEEISEGEK